MRELGAAFIAMPGHKGLFGPQGTGILLCGAEPRPIIFGGTGSSSAMPQMPDILPDKLEAGTHNVPGIAGLLAGMEYILERGEESILRRERRLIRRARQALEKIEGVSLYGGHDTGVLSFNIEGRDPEWVARELSERDIAVRAGLHCAPSAHRAIGTFPKGTVRISVSDFTEAKEIELFKAAVEEIVRGS